MVKQEKSSAFRMAPSVTSIVAFTKKLRKVIKINIECVHLHSLLQYLVVVLLACLLVG